MSKRIWLTLVLVVILSACASGDLAEDLTPIPTLPRGEEPALAPVVAVSTPSDEDGEPMGEDDLVALGEELFAANCAFCHGAEDGAGPAFPGMAERAAERVEGQSAVEYIHESIVDPHAHIVEGFNAMPPVADQFDETEIEALVAYIMERSGDDEIAAAVETPESTEADESEESEETEELLSAENVDLELGETLFAGNCAACHGATDRPGPAFAGMGERADDRVENMSAVEYLHESIVDPSAYVVEGYSDIMPKAYGEQFSEDEIASIIGYILEETGGEASSTSAADEEVTGDAEAGEQLFQINCTACHRETNGAGPALTGMGERAAERVDDQSAVEYLHESIVDPGAYVVRGYANIMPKTYSDQFSEDEINDLIAYILTQ